MNSMYTYYHWFIHNYNDGETVLIPNIKLVESSTDITSVSNDFKINIKIIQTSETIICFKYTLYNTEKEALAFAIKNLRRIISLLNNSSSVFSIPINPKKWIIKAEKQLDVFFYKYNRVYPEVFI